MTPSNGTGSSHAVRRHPPAVYRRRRVTVLGLAVVVLALFIVGIVLLVQALSGERAAQAPAGGQPQPGAEAGKPKSEQKDQAPGPQGDEASGMCPEDQVTLAASMDKQSYAPGAKASMTLQVKNEHTTECKIEVGSAAQQFIIQKDNKPVWDSAWCSAAGQNSQQVFAPGASKKSTVRWGLVPTDKNCNKTAEAYEPGQYQLVVKLGNATSAPFAFTIEKPEASGDKTPKPKKTDGGN